MSKQLVQLIISLIFIFCYMAMIAAMFLVEVSDSLNMTQGENSLMGELTVLLGVMTGGVTLILNFWFNAEGKLPKKSMMDAHLEQASQRGHELNAQRGQVAVEMAALRGTAPLAGGENPAEEHSEQQVETAPEEVNPSEGSVLAKAKNKLVSAAKTVSPASLASRNTPPPQSVKQTFQPGAVPEGPEESVGKSGNNMGSDVILVQNHLVSLGYFQDKAEKTRSESLLPNQEVEESEIPQTIKAIKRFQLYGLGQSKGDGRIDPRGNTVSALLARIKLVNDYKSHKIRKSSTPLALSEDQWISQFDSVSADSKGRGLRESEKARPGKPNKVCCWDTAQAMVLQKVAKIKHHTPERIPTIFQGDTKSTWIMNEQAVLGVKYIDKELEEGFPVFVGVDDGRTASYNADGTTEHYLVLVAKVVDQDRIKYRFFDPGTRHGHSKGYVPGNLLTLQDDFTLQGAKPGSSRIYTVSQVRQNQRS